MDRIAVLKKSDLFANLNESELRLVDAIAHAKQVEPGAIVCKQGKVEENIYIVENGDVAILLEIGPMSNRQVQAASTFESCGWSAMVEPFICTATVKATVKTDLLYFRGSDLRKLCNVHPEIGVKIYLAVARVVAARLRQAYDQLLGLACQD